jgi:hypothetical protein
MKATKVLEDLKQEDLQAISSVIHDFLHSEE